MRFSQENEYSRWPKSHQSTSSQGTQTTQRLKLPKSARILKKDEFRKIGKEKNRFVGDVLCLDFCTGPAPRLGITASKKFGNAVKRNHFKRLVREVFRQEQYNLPLLEINVSPKKGIKEITFNQIANDLKKLHDTQR